MSVVCNRVSKKENLTAYNPASTWLGREYLWWKFWQAIDLVRSMCADGDTCPTGLDLRTIGKFDCSHMRSR